MNFTEYFNHIYTVLNCSQTDIAKACELSAPVISRYLSGDRIPSYDSKQLKALAKGIHRIAASKNIHSNEFLYDTLLETFNKCVLEKESTFNTFVTKFNELIDLFNINMKTLAVTLNFDVSYLYRIKSGERHPVNLDQFCHSLSEYIVNNRIDDNNIDKAAKLLGCTRESILQSESFCDKLFSYLMEPTAAIDDIPQMDSFLTKMEDFNLDEYIKVIHFDELKVPNIPFTFPSSKYYYGINDMRKAELDFLKATVLGKSKDPIFMCSFMPMQEMADDMDFGKKWMFGIAMMIKKGLHLNVIHNLDRPMHELMLGFEAWIPIYMTGQVSPYHIPDYKSDVFKQINYCSGNAALMGECIDGFYDSGRYYVTNNKNEISYFKKKSYALLKTAEPLMEIYTSNEREKFMSFLKKDISIENDRRIIASFLPAFTIPKDILDKHISSVDSSKKDAILSFIKECDSYISDITKHSTLTFDICEISKDEYENNPSILRFPFIFSDFESSLSYEEYISHLNATKEYALKNSNFILNLTDTMPFNNIEITIVSGKYFMISKSKNPNIHFVIHHKKMLQGMENFYTAYRE